jgi:acyl-CoA thioesterase I
MKLAIFGDSIGWGKSDEKFAGWVNQLKILCMNKYVKNRERLDVYNRSVSGDTTVRLLKRFDNECKSIMPEVVIFAIGTNDCRYTKTKHDYNVSPIQFKKNLDKLLKNALKYSKQIIFINLPPVIESKVTPIPWHDTEYYYTKNLNEFNQIIKSFCKENNLNMINIFRDEVVLSEDGLHPNAKGHQKIFEIVRDYLEKEKLI